MELLPCPFCGRQPNVTTRAGSEPSGEARQMAFVACMCGGYSARAHQYGRGETVEQAKADAAAKWNTRPPPIRPGFEEADDGEHDCGI